MEILICGQWIAGRVEHDYIYVTSKGTSDGYYLDCRDIHATWIGLTIGMRVRIV